MQLVDIHSQHQNQLLTSGDFQLRVIDNLAGNGELLAEYSRRYNAYRNAVRRLHDTKKQLEQNRNDEDFTRFQLEQLDELGLTDGEQEQLEHDRDILSNITDIKTTISGALDSLSEGTHNALDLLSETSDYCEELSRFLEDSDNIGERLETVRIELRDIAETLTAYDQEFQADPEELEAIESRLNTIYSLQQKHRVSTVAELIALREELRDRLDKLENSSFTVEELEKEARRAKNAAKQLAVELSQRRSEEAAQLEETLRQRAMPLGMKNLRTQVKVTQGELTPTGIDKVEFLFAFNKNQPLMPVGGTASGGEISRLMLSIKAIIATKMQLPSIIFDEVDTGVSGDVADRMGGMMHDIARTIQVITITHLPQVAAKGNAHFKVYKEDDDESTHTRIRELTGDDRVGEIAVMLSGSTVDEAARANARSLLNNIDNK